MSDRWNIFKDGKPLGPFSAAEIRKQLRDGDLDPFDLVAREGSSLRRELVAVDELFETSGESDAFDDSAQTESFGRSAEPAARKAIDRMVEGEARPQGGFIPPQEVLHGNLQEGLRGNLQEVLRGNLQEVLRGNLHLASEAAVHASTQVGGNGKQPAQEGVQKRKKNPKHYHLKDAKGRVLGPLSASEVQALFYKGVIDKSVTVTKQGSPAKVAADKFVAVFSRSKGAGKRPQHGAHAALSGQQRQSLALNVAMARKGRLEQVRGQQALTTMLIVAAIAMLSLAAWLAVKKGAGVWMHRKWSALTAEELKKPVKRPIEWPNPLAVPPTGTLPRPSTFPGVERVGKGVVKIDAGLVKPKAKPVPTMLVEPKRAGKKVAKRRDPPKAKVVAKAAKKTVRVAKAAAVPAPAAASQVVAKPAPSAASQVVAKPAKAAKPAGPSVATLSDGQQVSRLGPMRYDPSAVATCEGACVVAFSGAGGTVTGRFFKDGFGEALAAHKGSAYISGIVRKSDAGTSILVQDVQ